MIALTSPSTRMRRNRASYVVEIDPFNPSAAPRSALPLAGSNMRTAEVVHMRLTGHVVVYHGRR